MTELSSLVGQWVAGGLISEEQGRRILATQKSPVLVASPRGSLVAEALGYVGGVLVLLAAIIITTIYWPQLTLGARSGLTAAAAAIPLAAGFALPSRMGRPRTRLRAVLWALAVAAFGLCVGVTLEGLKWRDEDAVLAAAVAALALAILLWMLQKAFLQQAALGVALAVTAVSAAVHLPDDGEATVGLALWGVGLAWLALTWGDLLAPQRTGYLLGGVAVVAGSQMTTQTEWGIALASATTVLLVTAAVLVRDLWLLGVGAVGVLITVPMIFGRYFEGELAAPLSLLGAGVLLIGLGVFTARRRGRQAVASPLPARIAPWQAIACAVVVIALVTPAVLLVGQSGR